MKRRTLSDMSQFDPNHHAKEIERLRALARTGPVTLVFSARDEEHNDAVVLRTFLLAGARLSSETGRR